jgi:acetate kinase
MNILALNAGSNTLRYKLVATGEDERVLTDGMVDHVKGPAALAAAGQAIDDATAHGIDAIAVRVVHGGARFTTPQRVTTEVRRALDALAPLAPLHMPTDLAIVDAAAKAAPNLPVFAAFDTAFHHTLPEVAWRYALPESVGPDVRRYGFHGFAHGFVTAELRRTLNPAPTKIVSLHLGGGTSACAVRDGQSVDVSMGFTPLEGLVMSTRCGDLDPGLLIHLMRSGYSADDLENLLYRKSGLLGVSGLSDDIRDLQPAAAAGDGRAELALELFAHRARKYVGAFAAVLGGVDAVVLSGALAENSPPFRGRVLRGLEWLGAEVDADRNAAAGPDAPARLHADRSKVAVWMIPAEEERQMARDVAATG